MCTDIFGIKDDEQLGVNPEDSESSSDDEEVKIGKIVSLDDALQPG
jgi:hypothetical protein